MVLAEAGQAARADPPHVSDMLNGLRSTLEQIEERLNFVLAHEPPPEVTAVPDGCELRRQIGDLQAKASEILRGINL